MKLYSLFIAFVALTTSIDHIYGANLNGDEADQHEHLRGMLMMAKGKKKCKQDSDCQKYDKPKYGECGKCIDGKCKKEQCEPNTSPEPKDITCGAKCLSDSDYSGTNGCSWCKPFGTYGECKPRCLEGIELPLTGGLLVKRGYQTGSTTVGGPCKKGFTRSSADVEETNSNLMSCGGFNSHGPLTSVWASENESDCRVTIEYDVHHDSKVACHYFIRNTCTNP